jgi:N,N'-diacetyllegionaminate synthase
VTQLIVELCQNHCGDRSLLSEMIAAAAEHGADIVKSQMIFSADLTHRPEFDEGRMDADGTVRVIRRPYAAEYERLKKLDLTERDHRFFIEECTKHHVLPMTTAFSRNRIAFTASLPWPKRIVKVASYDCASFAMIEELAKTFDHLYISTGATFDDEIQQCAALLKSARKAFTLFHCVTSYPNTLEMCNLRRMTWLRQFTDSVGWSDHTLVARDGIKAAKAAIALGANVIERHFTILESDKTKDGPVSITPKHLQELRMFSRLSPEEQLKITKSEIPEWEEILGTEKRDLTHMELLNRDYYRGRFASKTKGKWVYNWESTTL